MAQPIEVVGVLVPAADREHTRLQQIDQRVVDAGRIAPVADSAGQPTGNPEAALGRPQQQQTAVRGLVAAVEIDCEFLTRDGWQIEREQPIVGHGGCGSGWAREADRLDNELLRDPNALRHARRPIFNALMHGSG